MSALLSWPNRSLTAAVLLAAVSAAPARAQVFDNTLVGASTYHRADASFSNLGVGTAVRYRTLQFTVGTAGSYTFLMSTGVGGFDTYLFLYRDAFNPLAPLTNGVIANDDLAGSRTQSGFTTTLSTGTQYFLVQTAYRNTDTGAFTTTVTGPAAIVTAAVVPEPSTYALLGAGLLGVGGLARRRRGNPAA